MAEDETAFDCPEENCEAGFDSSRQLLSHVIDEHDPSEFDDLLDG